MRTILVAAALSLLTGCATIPPLNFSPPNIATSQVRRNAALVATTVTLAGKSEAHGKIDVAGSENGIAALWKTALDDSLTRMAMFRDDAPTRLSLVVKVLRLDAPDLGLVMVTHTEARYELIDRNTGAIAYATDIATDGRSPVGDNFYGMIRRRISAANSVQNNIATFLRQLETADLSTSMPPASQQAQPNGPAR